MPANRRLFQEGSLILAAALAIFWAVLRAHVQSLTIDESLTYTMFVHGPLKNVWVASSNNHVLNTLLMWSATHLLGTNSLTVRTPALLGAVLYVLTCYFLCRGIIDSFILRLSLFICLTFNPLIFDFLVAARGYGLADAFLLAALTIPVWRHLKGRPSLVACCIWSSLALGLSFSAQFSAAFVDLGAFLALFVWALRQRQSESFLRVTASCVLPGFFVALLLCGLPLLHWNGQDSLGPGPQSLAEMARILAQDCLFRLAPGSPVYPAMTFLKPWLFPVLALLCLAQLAITRLDGSWLASEQARWLGRFAAVLAGIAAFSLLLHWLSFRFHNFPLPVGRKGIYLVSLCTLVAGLIAAAPARSLASRWLHRAIVATFVLVAFYFLLCLRLNYFKEWEWDADVKDVYPVLARYNHAYGITDVGTSWLYVAALNYYREQSGKENFLEFKATLPDPPEGKSIYVLEGFLEHPFLEKEKLIVIFKGKSTGVVIAIKPTP